MAGLLRVVEMVLDFGEAIIGRCNL